MGCSSRVQARALDVEFCLVGLTRPLLLMKNSSKSPLVQGCIQPDRWVWGAHAPKSPNLKSCIPGPDATNPTASFIKISGLGMEGFVSPVEMQHFAEKGA